MLYLREANTQDANAEYEFVREIPTDENGFTNKWNGCDWDTFMDKALPEMLDYAAGKNLPEGFVPETFYFLWMDDMIVGEFRIRHHLCDSLRTGAGHIGYCIKKEFRGRGYAKEGLRLTLLRAKEIVPEEEIYLRVNKDNPASLRAQFRNGGYIREEDETSYFVRIRKESIMDPGEAINVLGDFCGIRDLPELTTSTLQEKYGFLKADVMVLFGGSILAGGDILAESMAAGVAKTYVIVGGEGHTTQTLRDVVHAEYPEIDTDGLPEAEVYARYLKRVYGVVPDHLETASTNCGNNITNLLTLLEKNGVKCKSVILCQDATMQRRMDAGMRKYAPDGMVIINFAAYRAIVNDGEYAEEIHGMWNMDRYVKLLMGEIPRLRDDARGYGPRGKGFIAHVDIPERVEDAFRVLREVYGSEIREANPQYASK